MRLPLLAAVLAMTGATGCVVHTHARHPVVYREVTYRYLGAHPIPDAWGDGWCFIEHDHVHEYAPEHAHYTYRGGVYVYARPTIVWYVGYHPIPTGGYCTHHGRHSHHYHPGSSLAHHYSWDRAQRVYVYRNPDPHGAGPVYGGRVPPPGSYNPPPGHGGVPPGHGGTPPGHNVGGTPPPGHIGNPGHGGHPPPGHAGTPPGHRGTPPGHVQGAVGAPPSDAAEQRNPGRGHAGGDDGDRGRGRGQDERRDEDRGGRPASVIPAGGHGRAEQPASNSSQGRGQGNGKSNGKGSDNDNRQKPPPPAGGRGR